MSGESKEPEIKLFGKKIPLSHVCNGVGNGKGKEGGDQEESEDEGDGVAGNDELREDESCSSEPAAAGVSSKSDEEHNTDDPREKVLKKPDRILACPRCNSMETKFCYYNNYNLNQPRHFCKNCQRYWTAGGTMRNVPVGSGRRKSKTTSTASNCRRISVTEALQVPNGFHPPSQLKTNGTILAFGSMDSRLSESMASVLNIRELIIPVACRNGQNGADIVNDDQTGNSLLNHERENSVSKDSALQNLLEIDPWPYPFPPPALVPQLIPIPLYPASASSFWSIPWIPQPTVSTSSPNSPSLGKHCRDDNAGKPECSTEDSAEKCLWIPKTLRIDNPKDAVKSSIWETDKAFHPNVESRSLVAGTSAFLQANPVAFSRSLNFHDNA